MQKLNQTVGIDRTVLKGFSIDYINIKILNQEIQKLDSATASAESITVNEGFPSIVKNQRISSISIQDKRFGTLKVKRTKSINSKQHILQAEMNLSTNDSRNNAYSLSSNEYKFRVLAMLSHFKETYGITINPEHMKITSLELNATFELDEPFYLYKDAIFLLLVNSQNNGKLASWYDIRGEKLKLETALVKNNSTELKIYDKSSHLTDMQILVDSSKSIMRIEYKFKDTKRLHIHSEAEFTNETLCGIFTKFFNRDILMPYKLWRVKYWQDLKELVLFHKKSHHQWTGYFFRDIRKKNKDNPRPALFALEDMKTVFDEIYPTKKNNSRAYKNFIKQAEHEQDLMGHSRRLKEILSKVVRITSSSDM